jgi:hypothetical protein
VQVVVPVPDGVTTPNGVIAPLVTLQVTPELKLPVPLTLAWHVAVWPVVIAAGEAVTETEVIVAGTSTCTVVLIDLDGSCTDVAVIVAVPAEVGVKLPLPLTPPRLDGLTDQVTAWL